MGNLYNNTGWARSPRLAQLNQRCRGFANTQLIIAIALLVVVGLLVQLQTCERIPFTGGVAKKASSSKRSGKAPELIPPAPEEMALAQAENKFITKRQNEVSRIDRMQRETIEAYAHMDGRRAALILGEMDPAIAVEILAKLRERDIARILEEAEPATAANWTGELLKKPDYDPVPDALKTAAARAGLYDNLSDLLSEVGASTDGSATEGGEPNTDTTSEETGEAGEALPAQPGAADGTAAPGESANPAANPPPSGDATTEEPPAESLA